MIPGHDLFKSAAGAGAGFTADESHGAVGAAQFRPVADRAGGQLGDVFDGQVLHRVGGVDNDGHAVQGDDMGHSAIGNFLVLQRAAGKAS